MTPTKSQLWTGDSDQDGQDDSKKKGKVVKSEKNDITDSVCIDDGLPDDGLRCGLRRWL